MKFLITFFLTLATLNAMWEFNTANEGFKTHTFNESNAWPFIDIAASSWSAADGNPDGHIYSPTTDGLDNRLYAVLNDASPLSVLGDLNNTTLTADFRRSGGTFQSPSGRKVIALWSIGDSMDPSGNWWVSKISMGIDLNSLPLDTWSAKSIKIERDNFMPWPNSANNTKDFEQLMADYSFIGITIMDDDNSSWQTYTNTGSGWRLLSYGTTSNNGAVLGIDNYGTISSTPPISIPFGNRYIFGLLTLMMFAVSLRKLRLCQVSGDKRQAGD
jgi:hypothetical protein